MKVLLIDAFDSFIYVIDQYLRGLGVEPTVVRSHRGAVDTVRAAAPDALLLGPGPGHPVTSGHVELVETFAGQIPILGVCLGHQAIGAAYGGQVTPAKHLMHGKTSVLDHDGRGVFARSEPDAVVTRYHSLVVTEESVPDELEVTARSRDDGYVMGLRHRSLPIESVQFHPESIMTVAGLDMFRSFFDTHTPGWDRVGPGGPGGLP